jgi:hypothetical protein
MKHLLIATAIYTIATMGVVAQQEISYAYDNNGNRISRTIVMVKALEDGETQPGVDASFHHEGSTIDQAGALHDGLDKSRFVIYPNPTSRMITIKSLGETEGKIQVQLLAPDGRLLDTHELDTNSLHTIDLGGYAEGQYLLVFSKDGERITWTIIKN